MNNPFDGFDDVVQGSGGIFDGTTTTIAGSQGGLHSFDTPTTTPRPDGVAANMQCRFCGRPVELVAEYPELVCVKYGISPHVVAHFYPDFRNEVRKLNAWEYSTQNQGWAPHEQCSKCGTPLLPIFTPEEASRLLDKARRFGWISPGGEKRVSEQAYNAVQAVARGQLQR